MIKHLLHFLLGALLGLLFLVAAAFSPPHSCAATSVVEAQRPRIVPRLVVRCYMEEHGEVCTVVEEDLTK